MATSEFKHDSVQDRQSIVRYLEAMIDGIRNGHLEFRNDEQEIVLEPSGLLELELRARRSDNKTKLSIKLAWKDREGAGGGELVIGGK